MQEDPEEASSRIAKLRIAAQEHLEEIDQETQQEERDDAKRQAELEKYMKRRRSPKPKSSDLHQEKESQSESRTKAPSMRTAQDVLDRLRWDQSLKIEEYRVGYLERFDGVREMKATSWINEFTDEEWIPQHRIKYFKRINPEGNEEIMWHRDERVDKIFGSAAGCP